VIKYAHEAEPGSEPASAEGRERHWRLQKSPKFAGRKKLKRERDQPEK